MSETEPLDRGYTSWWLHPKDDKHDAVTATVRAIRQGQEYRKVQDCLHASLYANRPITGFGWGVSRRTTIDPKRLSLNVIRNMVGAVTSTIAAKNKPKPTFLTEDGNADQRDQAEKLEKFVGGVFYESGVYDDLPECFRDACVYGTAFLHVYEDPDEKRVAVCRVKPFEMVVDDGEGFDCKPPNLYRRRYVDRGKLAEMYPEHDAMIRVCPRDAEDTEYSYQTTADQVLVTEAWHLSQGKAVGCHVICIANATLLDEEWKDPFPFAVMRWTKDVEGYFGIGLAEELRGIQTEINKLLMQIQRGHHLVAGHWLVMQGSTLTTQLNNDLAAIVRYTGTPPKYEAPGIIAAEIYRHLGQLYQWAFEISGISQLNATGQKPAGLDSGAAQRAYQDIQTERFLEVGQSYEEFVVDVARHVVRCAKRIGGSYKVRSEGKGSIEVIDWADIDIDEQSYVIRVYPTSLLPTTPAGKLAWAQDMIQAQVIPPEDVLDILDFPDTAAYAKRRLAARKSIEKRLLKIRKDGVPFFPEPFDDLKLLVVTARDTYHEWVNDGVDDTKLDMLRETIANAKDLQGEADDAAPPPMPMPGMPPGPGGPPMPMPPGPMPPDAMPPPMPPAPPMAA